MPAPRIRVLVATIEGQLAELAGALAASERPAALLAELRVAWAALVQDLPLAEPTVRGCHVCKHVVPRKATFCGFCFSKLTPAATGA